MSSVRDSTTFMPAYEQPNTSLPCCWPAASSLRPMPRFCSRGSTESRPRWHSSSRFSSSSEPSTARSSSASTAASSSLLAGSHELMSSRIPSSVMRGPPTSSASEVPATGATSVDLERSIERTNERRRTTTSRSVRHASVGPVDDLCQGCYVFKLGRTDAQRIGRHRIVLLCCAVLCW